MGARAEVVLLVRPWESDDVCPRCGFYFWFALADHPEHGWCLYRECSCES